MKYLTSLAADATTTVASPGSSGSYANDPARYVIFGNMIEPAPQTSIKPPRILSRPAMPILDSRKFDSMSSIRDSQTEHHWGELGVTSSACQTESSVPTLIHNVAFSPRSSAKHAQPDYDTGCLAQAIVAACSMLLFACLIGTWLLLYRANKRQASVDEEIAMEISDDEEDDDDIRDRRDVRLTERTHLVSNKKGLKK